MKKLLRIVLTLSLASCIGVIGISYYFVSYFLGKRLRDHHWHQKISAYRQELIEKYAGKPVSMKSDDGVSLAGLLFLRQGAKRTLLLCHGWLMNKERLRPFISMFPEDNILLFDFRAHGQSQGEYTSIGHHEKNDVIAAFNFLHNNLETKDLPIVGLGISMGAVSLASAAATGLPFAGIIIDSAFGRLDYVIEDTFSRKTGFPSFPFSIICQHLYGYFSGCSAEQVGACTCFEQVKVPLFVIHSKTDYLARFDVTKQLFEQTKAPLKDFWIVENGTHGRIHKEHEDKYREEVQKFLYSVDNHYASNSSVFALNKGTP